MWHGGVPTKLVVEGDPTVLVVDSIPTDLVVEGLPTRLVGTAYNSKSCLYSHYNRLNPILYYQFPNSHIMTFQWVVLH